MMQAVEEEATTPGDPTKFKGKKSKATAKKGSGSSQWDILRSSGIPEEELPQFRFGVLINRVCLSILFHVSYVWRL